LEIKHIVDTVTLFLDLISITHQTIHYNTSKISCFVSEMVLQPTIIGPKGNLIAMTTGTAKMDLLEEIIEAAMEIHPPSTLNNTPLPLIPLSKSEGTCLGHLHPEFTTNQATSLSYPSGLAVDRDNKRIFVSGNLINWERNLLEFKHNFSSIFELPFSPKVSQEINF
jgi:hypothetical protein